MKKKRIEEEVKNQDVLGMLSHEINESINRGEHPIKVERKFDAFHSYIMNNGVDYDENLYNEINGKVEDYLNQE